jgi:hypothetical protein
MKKQLVLISFFLFFLATTGISQLTIKQPDGGGDFREIINIKDEISPLQRTSIIRMLQEMNNYYVHKVLCSDAKTCCNSFASGH